MNTFLFPFLSSDPTLILQSASWILWETETPPIMIPGKTTTKECTSPNIRTLRQDKHLERLEEELKHFKWDSLNLSEMKLKKEMTTSLKSGEVTTRQVMSNINQMGKK